ncbi:MAG: DNA polymerase IV [Acidimicrobiia bacterium]|nr:DNA polymerase IV [Acidimicrobiia bacterium]
MAEAFSEPIIHVDMDAFFVEAERLRDPGLRGIPVVVGGSGPRAVVAAASYEARSFGIRSAMPMSVARRQCADLTIVPGDHGWYRELSTRVFGIMRDTTPLVEGISIDEAFLDVSGLRHHAASPVEIAERIRQRVRDEVGLPSSAGIASVKLIAKMASEAAKPDGVCHVSVEGQLEFLHGRSARALWGVGEATFAKLDRLGVETIGDIAALPERTLTRLLGPSLGRHLHLLSQGVDERGVEPESEAKSISVEETFTVDVLGGPALDTELLRLVDTLGYRLHRAGLAGRTIQVKVRFPDFTTVQRSHTLGHATALSAEILDEARALVASAVGEGRAVRLLGVGLQGLVATEERQMSLGDGSRDELEAAVHRVRDRFGPSSVGPAGLRRRPTDTSPGNEEGR